MRMVTMHHPALDQEIEVPESAAPIHVGAGWVPGAKPQEPAADDATAEPDDDEKPTTKARRATTTKE